MFELTARHIKSCSDEFLHSLGQERTVAPSIRLPECCRSLSTNQNDKNHLKGIGLQSAALVTIGGTSGELHGLDIGT